MKTQVIIPGTVKAGKNAKGFNLNKFVKQLLQSMGFAVTTDCCTYYPSFPTVNVADANSPTEEEIANIPVYGMFLTVSGDIWYLWMKNPDGTAEVIQNND